MNRLTSTLPFILLPLLCIATSCLRHEEGLSAESKAARVVVASEHIDSLRIRKELDKLRIPVRFHQVVFSSYTNNIGSLIWIENGHFNQHAILASAFFWRYLHEGLLDKTAFLPQMESVFRSCNLDEDLVIPSSKVVSMDIAFTSQCIMFMSRLSEGKGPELTGQKEWYIPVRRFMPEQDVPVPIIAISKPLTSPLNGQYVALSDALTKIKSLHKKGALKPVRFRGKNILPGDSSKTIREVKVWVQAFSGYDPYDTSSIFHSAFADRVREVRLCLGLNDTALVDEALINRMNIPIQHRIRTILVNLERWKWLAPDTSTSYIRINIPDYSLEVIENGVIVKRMKAVVGSESNHTVMFKDEIEQIIFSPYWHVPSGIFEKELWPKLRRDRQYLAANDMEVLGPDGVVDPSRIAWSRYTGKSFPYQIQQKPGPKNPLGLVKFHFPNPYHIYIHDTPNRELFFLQKRPFSHGCIRISEPEWLAAYLLKDFDEWNEAAIDSAMHSGVEQFVPLKNKVPVYITYFTSWVNETGLLQFRDDIYGHDTNMEQTMFPE